MPPTPKIKVSPSVQTIDPHQLFDSRPTFSHVATSSGPSRLIITAGQVGADSTGKVPPGLDLQVPLALENLTRCLEAAGAKVTDIIKLTYYIVGYDHKNRRHTPHLIKFLNGHRPATTLVPVPALVTPDHLFEIEATAAIPLSPVREVDVVVVGAGLSGLQTAYDLQKAGISCAVLEARDRVGGKTYSVEPVGGGKVVDLGAAWINDTNQARVHALTKKLGLETVIQNTVGNVVQQDLDGSVGSFAYGGVPKLNEINGTENMAQIRDLVEDLCQKLDLYKLTPEARDFDKLNFEEFVKSRGGEKSAMAAATVWTRAMLGLEPREISALFFLDYCNRGGGLLQMRSDKRNGGQYLRLPRGTQSLSLGLAKLLKPDTLVLSSPVRLIRQDKAGAYVSSARGDFKCRKVVVSIPTPLYKKVVFEPPLPKEKAELTSRTILGDTVKAMVLYDSPWWRASNLCGMVQSFKGPISVTRDSSVDHLSQFSLTCFLVGDPGRQLSKKSKAERHQAVLAHLHTLFSPFVSSIPEPIAIAEHEWAKDQWAQGCPCPATPPGVMSEFGDVLRTAWGNVHFVGTETAVKWKGYMDGAIESGERGAEEVIQSLNKAKL
ncbi:putative mao-B [Tricladium varicosporioides]|nr:putative mao-B [Hymenoscyphus varicosporioides]